MTRALASNEEELVRRMGQSKEKAEWGFDLLITRRPGDLDSFFDPLEEAGLFDPRHNSGPVALAKEGLVHIPFWPALKYLQALARLAGEKNDLPLTEKILGVIRSVSTFREPDGRIRDNDNTFRVFAEIFGLVPLEAVTSKDIDLIPVWLASKFDRGHVAATLDKGYMQRALSSTTSEDWIKACRVLYHCTALEWVPDRWMRETERLKPVSVVEDYWLDKLIQNNTESLGTKVGRQASDIFIGRLREVFGAESTVPSHWSRSTIEDSDQNTPVEEPSDRFVEGLRDILLYWAERDQEAARDYVRGMLSDDTDIIRRIAIHTVNHRWSALRDLYFPIVSVGLFSDVHLHELYQLLRSHFGEFTEEQKAETLKIIRSIPPEEGDDGQRLLRRMQRNWLSAIVNQGHEPADNCYEKLDADPTIGNLSKYPSLHGYLESWSGPGPSPFSVTDLIQNARTRSLIELLHSFPETDGFQGPETPTMRALVDTLSKAVKQEPEVFIVMLPDFLRAKRQFQYGIIEGLKYLWDDAAKSAEQQVDWYQTWTELMEFCDMLLSDPRFWKEEAVEDRNMTPNRDWIPPLVASFLKAGTQSDKHAYPEELLPRGWKLINCLLEHVVPEEEPSDDPMNYAINSSKGKVIEALFNHALRASRVADKAKGKHSDEWEQMSPTFERELSKCKGGNYAMSTLSGSYIANLDYLSRDWLTDNVEKIFPDDYPVNFSCAVDGMAYAPEHRHVYKLLTDKKIIDKALKRDLKGRHSREKLIQRIALAYLWGDEKLEGPRFSYLFESKKLKELEEVSDFLWSVSTNKLRDGQVERVLAYWALCIGWSQTLDEPPAALLSSLSRLACYLREIDDEEERWLLAVAPYAHVGHDADRFIEELDRLADRYPRQASAALARVLETYNPVFDFEDRLKSLITKIAAAGGDEGRAAMSYADKLCQLRLKGMCDLFRDLSSKER